ncbi:hypothetical protein AB0C38_13610 [Amycolatopsis sp. NPDC048633]|uniref:hypothetical protein n=1 Tax=Amycolatopsis sp. NPDC048633 TaxID=3157095 RepID=UPI0033CB4FE9
MRVRVHFRYNSATGEVEMFTVEAVDADVSDADHDRRHDAATTRIAGVVDRHPLIDEVVSVEAAPEPVETVFPGRQEPPESEGRRVEEPRRG